MNRDLRSELNMLIVLRMDILDQIDRRIRLLEEAIREEQAEPPQYSGDAQ